jgi:hypothetical protein
MPSLLEMLRIDLSLLPGRASTNPVYLIIRYLRGTRRRAGYYSNRRMREFIKDGTWDATAVLFARTFTHLKDEGDQMGDTGEELSYSPNPLLKQAPSPSEPFADYTRICGLDLAAACGRPFLDRI